MRPTITAAAATAGYSGKPLAEKLGFKPGMRVAFLALPPSLAGLADEVSDATTFSAWRSLPGGQKLDAVHAFTTSRAEIETGLEGLQGAIKRDGMIWVSWPKKAARVPADVTEDVVRAYALALDLVDVKVCAVDEIWSGLKLVIRKERR